MELIIKCNDQDIEKLFKNRFPDMDKIREDFWRENENGKLKDEIQDLKLENDRLKQREEIMLKFLKSAKCDGISCSDCLFFNDTYPIGRKCVSNRNSIFYEISNKATKILEQMETL